MEKASKHIKIAIPFGTTKTDQKIKETKSQKFKRHIDKDPFEGFLGIQKGGLSLSLSLSIYIYIYSHNFNRLATHIRHHFQQINCKHGGLPGLRQSASAGRVSHREGCCRSGHNLLARTEPLSLHVLLFSPRPHMHFVFIHAFFGGRTQDFDQTLKSLYFPDKHFGKSLDKSVVFFACPGHLELCPEIQLDYHPRLSFFRRP